MNWLILITSLPTANASARMRAWRALKSSGAVVLRDGVYLLPASEVSTAALSKVERDIVSSDGTAYLLNIIEHGDYPFAALFDRTEDYRKLAEDITSCCARLQDSTSADLTREVRKLRNVFTALSNIDFFPGEAQRQLSSQLTALEIRLAEALAPNEPTGKAGSVQPRNPTDYTGRQWATRKQLWIDRVCSAWLIRRFIDTDARFIWLDSPSDCPVEALGFDFDGASFTHIETQAGLLVSFENLIASFGLKDNAALQRFAQIVHYLDVGGLPVPEAAGLERLLKGIRARTSNDDSMLHEASQLFDDLYLAFQQEDN